MQEPGWKLFHWALLALGRIGLIVLALQRRWEALLIAVIFLAITAISALLVASPRRVLVMMPLLAALAGVGAMGSDRRLAVAAPQSWSYVTLECELDDQHRRCAAPAEEALVGGRRQRFGRRD